MKTSPETELRVKQLMALPTELRLQLTDACTDLVNKERAANQEIALLKAKVAELESLLAKANKP